MERLAERALIKDSEKLIQRFAPEKPSAMTGKMEKIIDKQNIENNLAVKAIMEKKKRMQFL